MGWCGLKWHEDAREYDLGYRFFEADWGQGYATEACRACMAFARRHLASSRIMATARPENAASLHVLEKLGFRFEGTRDERDGKVAVLVAPPFTAS